MADKNESLRLVPFNVIVAVVIAAIAISLAALAQARAIPVLGLSSTTQPVEVRIVSTEFRFSPAAVSVDAGRAVTLVLDNSGAETEHGLSLPALGFRLQASAGEIARKTFAFDKPGKYEFECDLPGHREAGMKGTLIVQGS